MRSSIESVLNGDSNTNHSAPNWSKRPLYSLHVSLDCWDEEPVSEQ
jgi:hypothetical protein